jgi:hypothetical protein
MTEPKKDYDRIIKEIRLDRDMKKKRLFEQAKRARKNKTVAASKEETNE